MIGTPPSPIVPLARRFSHEEACRVSRLALKQSNVRTVVIDLKYATDATTSAFARLVLLRRLLRATGRDLRLVNLRARTEHLYEINKLEEVLPRA
ncbi:MAG TPA: STAS domain-containing protein [Tepidisphaeraceae bacterium]|nr:STAS domain-containing protein [Tepidisphaeraceae bacterium]